MPPDRVVSRERVGVARFIKPVLNLFVRPVQCHLTELGGRRFIYMGGAAAPAPPNKMPGGWAAAGLVIDETDSAQASAMPRGCKLFHNPREKSGMATGTLPPATEWTEVSMMLLQAAAS